MVEDEDLAQEAVGEAEEEEVAVAEEDSEVAAAVEDLAGKCPVSSVFGTKWRCEWF